MKNTFRLICAVIALILCLSGTVIAADAPFGIVLSAVESGGKSVAVTWRADTEKAAVMQVVLREDYDENGFEEATEFVARCRDISLDGSGKWHYEAVADGLLPGTEYVYRVGGDDRWSDTHSFVTDDPSAETLTFAYMGDVQPAGDSAAEFKLWGELAQAVYESNPELAFAVLGGDIVNSGISLEQFDVFRENAEPVFANVPLFSTAGNHESNFPGGKPELFLDMFAFPTNGPEGFEEEFYSFYAANCHILVLNSWIFSGEQLLTEADIARVNRWIAAELAGSEADWQIVVTHIPVYAVHSDSTSVKVRENWAPIFEKYGADLVFVGHQHVYSRSYPLYKGKIDYEKGLPYIMGVSGSKFYGSADETKAERTIYNTATCQLVQIDGDVLTVRTVDVEGNELDYAVVAQRTPEQAFSDVPGDAACAAAVCYGKAAGLFEGVADDMFDPDGVMTRAMFATVLHRFAGEAYAGETVDGAWYSNAASWAVEKGLMSTEGGTFEPDKAMTFEEAAVIFERYTGREIHFEKQGVMNRAQAAEIFLRLGGQVS